MKKDKRGEERQWMCESGSTTDSEMLSRSLRSYTNSKAEDMKRWTTCKLCLHEKVRNCCMFVSMCAFVWVRGRGGGGTQQVETSCNQLVTHLKKCALTSLLPIPALLPLFSWINWESLIFIYSTELPELHSHPSSPPPHHTRRASYCVW